MLVAEDSPCGLLNRPSFKAVVYSYVNRCIDPIPATLTRSSANNNVGLASIGLSAIHRSATLRDVSR
jgi:hypothetical protein